MKICEDVASTRLYSFIVFVLSSHVCVAESIAGSESDSDTDSMGMVYSPQKKHGTLKSMFSSSLRKSKSTQTFRDQRLYHDTLVKPPYMLVT